MVPAVSTYGSGHHAGSTRHIIRRIAAPARRAVSGFVRQIRALDDRGALMMEFALAAIPFFLLLFGTLELGLVFVTNVCLANATQGMARGVRVGTVTLPGATATTGTGTQMTLPNFKTAICAGIPIMTTATCMAQLQVDVRTQASFGTSATPNPVVAGNFSSAGFCFYSGAPGNIVTLRAFLLWPIMTPGLLSMLSTARTMTTSGGTTIGTYIVLSSSEVFKNEPNPNVTNTGTGC